MNRLAASFNIPVPEIPWLYLHNNTSLYGVVDLFIV